MTGKKAVHFGAGRIGRGLIGPLLYRSGFEVVFVDTDESIVRAFKRNEPYWVVECDAQGKVVGRTEYPHPFRALNPLFERHELIQQIKTADLITCRVGKGALPNVASVISAGIKARSFDARPLTVVACESDAHAISILRRHLQNALDSAVCLVRFLASIVVRLVSEKRHENILSLVVEKQYDWLVDRNARGLITNLSLNGVEFVRDFEFHFHRKNFAFEVAKLIAGYCAHDKELEHISGAFEDASVRRLIRTTLGEIQGILAQLGASRSTRQERYIGQVIKRLGNPGLSIKTQHITRNPLSNLEILIGIPGLIVKDKGRHRHYVGILQCIAMLLRYQDMEGDEESCKLGEVMRSDLSPSDVVMNLVYEGNKGPLYRELLKLIKMVRHPQHDFPASPGCCICLGINLCKASPPNADAEAAVMARRGAVDAARRRKKTAVDEAAASKSKVLAGRSALDAGVEKKKARSKVGGQEGAAEAGPPDKLYGVLGPRKGLQSEEASGSGSTSRARTNRFAEGEGSDAVGMGKKRQSEDGGPLSSGVAGGPGSGTSTGYMGMLKLSRGSTSSGDVGRAPVSQSSSEANTPRRAKGGSAGSRMASGSSTPKVEADDPLGDQDVVFITYPIDSVSAGCLSRRVSGRSSPPWPEIGGRVMKLPSSDKLNMLEPSKGRSMSRRASEAALSKPR